MCKHQKYFNYSIHYVIAMLGWFVDETVVERVMHDGDLVEEVEVRYPRNVLMKMFV